VTRGAVTAALGDVAFDTIPLPCCGQGANLGRIVTRISDRQRFRESGEKIDDLGVPGARRKHAGAQETRLAVVQQRGGEKLLTHGLQVEVRVVEHDCRRLAAQFERDGLEQLAANLADGPAGRRRTGERDLVDTWVSDEIRADVAPRGDHVDHARRKSGFGHRLGENVSVQHCFG